MAAPGPAASDCAGVLAAGLLRLALAMGLAVCLGACLCDQPAQLSTLQPPSYRNRPAVTAATASSSSSSSSSPSLSSSLVTRLRLAGGVAKSFSHVPVPRPLAF
eukprot:5965889-Pyramimonas_sp.AAC.1